MEPHEGHAFGPTSPPQGHPPREGYPPLLPPGRPHRRRRFVVLVIAGSVLVLLLAFFYAVGSRTTDSTAVRPVLTQEVRPGAAYRYGPNGVYNACSLVTLDELRRQGLTPAPDQVLREYYPVLDQSEVPPNPSELSGPSDCHIFIEGRHGEGNVQIEVQQAPYTDLGFIDRQLPKWERDGQVYAQDGAKVVLPPDTSPDFLRDDDQRIAEAHVFGSARRVVVHMVVALKAPADDPLPILKRLIELAAPRLSAPPTREMALAYTPSDGDEPDACEVLNAADVRTLLGGSPKGFVHREADLAESRIWLNNGRTTYFTQTRCERGLARAPDAILAPPSTAALTLRGYHDVASAQATMRQKLDPHGSGFGPPVVLATIGDDPGVVTAPVFGDRKVVFRVGRYIAELDYSDGTENAESPDVLAERVPPVAQDIADRLR